MRVFATDAWPIPLPEGHRFPADKYRLTREAVQARGLGSVEAGPAIGRDDLLRVHGADYVDRVLGGSLDAAAQRRIGFPWSPQLVERSLRSVGATLAACRAALDDGVAVYLGGGTHHAQPDVGEGYCVFNDVAVAIRALQVEDRIARAIVLDGDVHQGNGTAAIFAGDASVWTFSIHGARNFPLRKVPSDLDVGLPDGTTDEDYLPALDGGLEASFAAMPDADLAVYLAGADPLRGDRFGRMELSHGGLRARDRRVLDACAARRIPVAVTLAGGYGREVTDTVEAYVATVALAAERAADYSTT